MSVGTQVSLFVWNELMSTDVRAARDFYTKLFGWRATTEQVGGMDYHMIFVGEYPIAGMMQASEARRPSHWMCYVSVADVDKRTELAVRLGAEQMVAPRDIPGIGRFSVIRDRQGAHIALFKSSQAGQMPTPPKPGPGQFVWYELMTTDIEAARKFYGEIFGWEEEAYPMEGGQTYWMFKAGGRTIAGAWHMPPGADYPPHWLVYIGVNDVDASARKATQLGGKVLKEPADIPEVGRFAVLADPTGGVCAIFKGRM